MTDLELTKACAEEMGFVAGNRSTQGRVYEVIDERVEIPCGEYHWPGALDREPTEAMLNALEQGPVLLHDSESWQDYQRRQWALVLAACEEKK